MRKKDYSTVDECLRKLKKENKKMVPKTVKPKKKLVVKSVKPLTFKEKMLNLFLTFVDLFRLVR